MPQIRVSEESYRLLKERAQRERRTLSNMVEVLLIPRDSDLGTRFAPTPDDNLPTLVESGAASRATQRSQCVCPAEMVRKGKHLRQCTART